MRLNDTKSQVGKEERRCRSSFVGTEDEVTHLPRNGTSSIQSIWIVLHAAHAEDTNAASDGSVRVADPTTTTPFADVSFFHSSQQLQLTTPLTNVEQLKSFLAQHLPSANRPYAFKISGIFPAIKFRSVPKQSEPYPTLTDAVTRQIVFEERSLSGTLVGYVLPDYFSPIGVSGYHFHFISTDKLHGGHVLDMSLTTATMDIDDLASVKLLIPQNATFQQTDFSKP